MNTVNMDLVDTSLSVDVSTPQFEVDFDGAYPAEVGNHFVLVAQERDTRRYICGTCGKKIEVSETIWRSAEAEQRRAAEKYAFGYFCEENCTQDEIGDVIQHTARKYVGEPNTPDLRHRMEQDLREELVGQ